MKNLELHDESSVDVPTWSNWKPHEVEILMKNQETGESKWFVLTTALDENEPLRKIVKSFILKIANKLVVIAAR